MLYRNPVPGKTTLLQRIALIILGVFLCCVFLEIALALGGWIIVSRQEHQNAVRMQQKGTYRILCLGESTTEAGPDPYPAQLEEVLNSRNIGVKFSVINKGLSGVNTDYIAGHLEENLDTYKPDMVVTMMGVNDYGVHIPWEYGSLNRQPGFIQSLKIYKLIRLLWLHIMAKFHTAGVFQHKEGRISGKPGGNSLTFGAKRPVVVPEKNPRPVQDPPGEKSKPGLSTEREYINLGYEYTSQARNIDSEEMFKKVLQLNPVSYDAYLGLAFVYSRQGRIAESEATYYKAIELDPKNVEGYLMLAWRYTEMGKHKETEELVKKAFALGLKNVELNFRLGWAYKMQGKEELAQEQFKKVTELLYPKKNDPEGVDKTYGRLATLYKEIGEDRIADEYYKKANKSRIECYNPSTRRNYRKVKEILDRRGVKFVCVQYPVRSAKPLQKMFQGEGAVIVDNERSFSRALKEGGYKEYFTDMFGGDFGHCTTKGNRLLAENIADAILKEYFRK
jgi:Tfp pilus assembly protein PilF